MLALNLNNLKETVFIYFKYIILLIGKGKKTKWSHLSLRVKKLADGVLQFVKQHWIQSRAQLQTHQVLNIGPYLKAHFLMVTHH